MIYIPFIVVLIISALFEYFVGKNASRWFIVTSLVGFITIFVIAIDYRTQTDDTEIWSGTVISWEHQEEYEEWVPESCTTSSNGTTSCTPGYYQHHDATNKIKTSDNGWMDVYRSPINNKKFNDDWPNTTAELTEMWPAGTPSASTHRYTNKVQASYSIYRNKEIDEDDYPDLPDYPLKVWGYININRIVGKVPNRENALVYLAQENSRLNEFIPDPEKPGKKRSWKQVNLIFVNVGAGKGEDYGIALQNKWENGNKNDLVVSFSMEDDGTINWVYAFSWSEIEILKLEIRDAIMGLGKVNNFIDVEKITVDLVAEKFVRKQFADFDYLHITPSPWTYVFIWILSLLCLTAQFISWVCDDSSYKEDLRFLSRYQ